MNPTACKWYEEEASIDAERGAFERRQASFFTLLLCCARDANRALMTKDLDEWEAAEEEWQSANLNLMQIANEISVGNR